MLEKIPKEILDVMRIVHGYLVGGSVRDILMGREPKDYDIATPLTPEEVERILHKYGYVTYEVGKRFGTVGAIVDIRGIKYKVEITTFRKETYDFISRKPKVVFTKNLLEDLSRRDFTINAMAIGPDGKLIDPFGGVKDIRAGIIRFVGNPEHRILEDPLRILRAFRFAARFGYTIEPNSATAIRKLISELKRISKERIKEELIKASETRRFWQYCELNYEYGAFKYYGPTWAKVIYLMGKIKHSVGRGHYGETVWQHTIDVLKRMDDWGYVSRLKIAGLMHDVGKPETVKVVKGVIHFYEHEKVGVAIAEKMLRELKFSNKTIKYVAFMVRWHMRIGWAIEEYKKGNFKPLARLAAKAIMTGYGMLLRDLVLLYQADSNTQISSSFLMLIDEIASFRKPKFPPSMAEKIPPRERENYLYGRLVEKILSFLKGYGAVRI